jgi:mono/diheme cytochrome c family protein
VTLLPLLAVEAGATPTPAVAQTDRGRRLFVAKGCVTCHRHGDVESETIEVGPELTGRRYPADYLSRFLANPEARTGRAEPGQMPNLRLKTPEIAALVAFLNTERQASGR